MTNKIAATVAEATAITGLSRSAIYRAVKAKQLVKRRHGGRTLFLVSDLERFIQGLPVSEDGE